MSDFNLQASRQELGLSVTDLARALHLTLPNGRTFIREMESGKRPLTGPVRAAVELMLKQDREERLKRWQKS
jgi:hypothetical protein